MINTSNNNNRVRVIGISRRKMHFWEGRRMRVCNERKIQHAEDRKKDWYDFFRFDFLWRQGSSLFQSANAQLTPSYRTKCCCLAIGTILYKIYRRSAMEGKVEPPLLYLKEHVWSEFGRWLHDKWGTARD